MFSNTAAMCVSEKSYCLWKIKAIHAWSDNISTYSNTVPGWLFCFMTGECIDPYQSKKVKESRKRPDVAQRVPGSLGSQISITFGTWMWWGCQPHIPAAFTPRKCPWYSFSLGAESTPRPWYGRKEYVTEKPSDTTGTVRLVAQRLNHYATPGPIPG